jgi:hypothetical protein
MKPLLLTAVALGLGAGQSLSTDYSRDRSLNVSVVSKTESETTTSRTLDGEPVEGRGGGGGGTTSGERSYSFADSVLVAKDGAPKKVKRVFSDVGGSSTRPSRDGGSQDVALESAFSGATVVIDATGAETTYEVVEGKLEDEQLAGLVPTLALDRLLPADEVEVGATWELEGADVLAAVGHELERNLFRRAAPEGGGEGRGERGGRGQGGAMGGRMGGGGFAMLENGEWDAKAKLTDETEEVDGVECAVITLEVEVTGELEFGGGGRGRDRAFELEAAPLANTYEAEFKGRLLWSTKEARPVKFTLTGTLETVLDFERETPNGVNKTHTETETSFDLTVDVTTGPKAE